MERQNTTCLAAGNPAIRRDIGQCRPIGSHGHRKRDRQAWCPARRQTGFQLLSRSSAELCAAILRPNELTPTVLRQYLARIDDDRLKRVFAATIETDQPKVSSISKRFKHDSGLWSGLSSRRSRQL